MAHSSLPVTFEQATIEMIPKAVLLDTFPTNPVVLHLSSYIPTALMVLPFVLYLLCVTRFWTSRPSEKERKRLLLAREYHNIIMFLYSGACSFGTCAWLTYRGELTNWNRFLCSPVEGTWLRLLSISFVLSKLYVMRDTYFIMKLGRRPLRILSPKGFLHTYHHATTFWLFCFVVNLPGAGKAG